MMSNEFLVDMSNLGVQLAPTAGEAHWQLGIVERMIRTVWSAAERVMKETGVDIHEAVSLSVKSQNQVERVNGVQSSPMGTGTTTYLDRRTSRRPQ